MTETGIIKRGECGSSVVYTLEENGVLTISGKGPMRNFMWNEELKIRDTPWWDERAMITRVEIQHGVTIIGSSAFNACTTMTSITIPDSVTYIGTGAFDGCIGLTSITIPDSVTETGDYTFCNCAELTGVTISSKTTKIGNYAFCDCKKLTTLHIPDSVTQIGKYAFYNCATLKDVVIPDSVKEIASFSFWGCLGLTNISVPDKVRIKDRAFPASVHVIRREPVLKPPRSTKIIKHGEYGKCGVNVVCRLGKHRIIGQKRAADIRQRKNHNSYAILSVLWHDNQAAKPRLPAR